MMHHRKLLDLILHFLLFLIPVNIYMIGDGIGAGIQWSLFRYQSTYLGISIITVLKDLNYVLTGEIAGKTAISLTIWILGAVVLIFSLLLHIYNYSINIHVFRSKTIHLQAFANRLDNILVCFIKIKIAACRIIKLYPITHYYKTSFSRNLH